MAFFEFGVGSLLSPLIRVIEGIWSKLKGRKGQLSASDIVQIRMKRKQEFEGQIRKRNQDGLRKDVIIRDVSRLDEYPDSKEISKGISPWFRVGLVGTYHAGIQLVLDWRSIVCSPSGKYIYKDPKNDDEESIRAALVGYVPYEYIEAADWNGDEYYGFPIIYCHFDTKRKEPYERLVFCERKTMDHPEGEIELYSEIIDMDEIHCPKKKAFTKLWKF
jgi:hypothetical protein